MQAAKATLQCGWGLVAGYAAGTRGACRGGEGGGLTNLLIQVGHKDDTAACLLRHLHAHSGGSGAKSSGVAHSKSTHGHSACNRYNRTVSCRLTHTVSSTIQGGPLQSRVCSITAQLHQSMYMAANGFSNGCMWVMNILPENVTAIIILG